MTSTLIFDVEAVALDIASSYLEPATAPSNYKDEAKIAAYIEQANREALARAALDVDLARIVALGWQEDDEEPRVALIRDSSEEQAVLTWFWSRVAPAAQPRPTLIGFNCLGYDLLLLLRRSLYLGVKTPRLHLGKYRHDGIEDLMLALSFDGALKYRGLPFYCKRFGIEVPDEHTGADIATLFKDNNWEAIEAHCLADLAKTRQLAERLGVVQATPSHADIF